MMREELSEKVETVYAEEYAWPLGARGPPAHRRGARSARRRSARRRGAARWRADSGTRRREKRAPARARRARTAWIAPRCARRAVAARRLAASSRCAWDPSRPFDRDAPAVKEAIARLDGGRRGAAATHARGLPLHRRVQGRQHRHARLRPPRPTGRSTSASRSSGSASRTAGASARKRSTPE